MSGPTYSIVSLAWNKLDLTKGFFERLYKHTPFEFEMVFTDNGSEEPISDFIRSEYPKVKLITEKKNIGCPATRNIAMKQVTGDIVFWLDNDTYVDENWYKPFLEALKDETIGIVGVDGRKVRNPFDYDNPWVFPKEFYDFEVDWFVGYAVAFRRKLYKEIPNWNLSVNFDDVDLCMGIKVNGGRAVMLDDLPNLEHLTSQTGEAWKPQEETIVKWWEYWSPHKGKLVEYVA